MRNCLYILILLLFSSCANRVSPTGGPKDETPPIVLESTPQNNSVNISDNSIQITFDEYIKPFLANEIIVSPYQNEAPELQFVGKSVIINLQDELLPNTTYSIDFDGAVKDYRQDNEIEDMDFVFSTGAVIDSAQLQGRLVDAESGEAFLSETMRILVYPESDSLIFKEPPLYIAKVDSAGNFSVNNLVAGQYDLFALEDLNFNNYFDQIGEAIAFLDQSVNTADSSSQDLTMYVHLSEDTVIRLENSNSIKEGQGDLIFSKKHQKIEIDNETDLYIERSIDADSLSVWYTNAQVGKRALFGNDTFIDSVALKEYADSLGIHQNFKFRSSQLKTDEAPLRLRFKHPININDPEAIELFQDSVLLGNASSQDKGYDIQAVNRALEIEMELIDTARYYVAIYPGALENFYGYVNDDTLSQRFKRSTFEKTATRARYNN